jgi:ABC-type antimicrobial peptide transport system permease subunit
MKLPRNGVAREIRHYSGALVIFFFIIGIIVTLIQYPVLDSNKEIVMTLIGMLAASLAMVVSTITGSKPDDVNDLKTQIEKKDNQIDLLVKQKDEYESMIIKLQREIIENQDQMFDRIMLKATMDFDDKKQKNG